MAALTSEDAAAALVALSSVAIERRNELEQYSEGRPADSDEDSSSDNPVFDAFYDQDGARAIIEMTNFEPQKFTAIWAGFEQFITSNFNVGRGRKSAQTPKDVLFMTLAVLKHGGNWDFLARMFGLSASSFERLVMKFVHLISEAVYESYVDYQARK